MELKLNINRAALLMRKARHISAICEDIADAERLAPINVHSHGNMVDNLEWEMEHMLETLRAFKNEVQGR